MNQIFSHSKLKLDRDYSAKFIKDNFLRQYAADSIISRLEILKLYSGSVLEIGAHAGLLTSKLSKLFDIKVTDSSSVLLGLNPCSEQINIDDEALELKAFENDLILSSLNLHWINDVLLFLGKIYYSLKPDGFFIANFIGGSSLRSLRKKLVELEIELGLPARPHVSPFITKEDITGLMRKVGFASVITESDCLEVEHPNILSLMRDLKNMGESNKLIKASGQTLGKSLYLSVKNSPEKFITEFEIITVCGKK
jgi:hypothetical protein